MDIYALAFFAAGKSQAEIAQILGPSERIAVQSHVMAEPTQCTGKLDIVGHGEQGRVDESDLQMPATYSIACCGFNPHRFRRLRQHHVAPCHAATCFRRRSLCRESDLSILWSRENTAMCRLPKLGGAPDGRRGEPWYEPSVT